MSTAFYYEAVDRMERMEVSRDFMLGWMGGYLGNPKVEEQRITETYEAGYVCGTNQDTSEFESRARALT